MGCFFRLRVNMCFLPPRKFKRNHFSLQYSDYLGLLFGQGALWAAGGIWNADIWCFRSSWECPQRSGVQSCGLRAQGWKQGRQTQGLRSKSGTKTASGSPKVASSGLKIRICRFCVAVFSYFLAFFSPWISSASNALCAFVLFSLWNLVKMCGFLGPAAKTRAVQTKQTQSPPECTVGFINITLSWVCAAWSEGKIPDFLFAPNQICRTRGQPPWLCPSDFRALVAVTWMPNPLPNCVPCTSGFSPGSL